MLVNAAESVALSNRHRLLRRGRSYGPPLVDSMKPEDVLARGPDGVDRGLCFICLTANISRQFEFVQGSWINDPTFNQPQIRHYAAAWMGIGAGGTAAGMPDVQEPPWYCFGSRHPGGLMFAYADGSVRFIRDTIPLQTYRQLATIKGNEVTSAE